MNLVSFKIVNYKNKFTYSHNDLEAISASASNGVSGVFSRGSLLVDFNLGTLKAGETVTLNIMTRLPDRAGVFTGTLSSNPSSEPSSLSITVVKQLPSTGETPAWAVLLRRLLGLE